MKYIKGSALAVKYIYTNVPHSSIPYSYKELQMYTGVMSSDKDFHLGLIFAISLEYVLMYMLRTKKRIGFLKNKGVYIDFSCIPEETVLKSRQSGFRQDLDLVNSDFKAYGFTVVRQYRKFTYRTSIYLGGDIYKAFIKRVNSGEKFYTNETIFVEDLYDEMHDYLFPTLNYRDYKLILTRGFDKFLYLVKRRVAVTASYPSWNIHMYVGMIFLDNNKQRDNYRNYLYKKAINEYILKGNRPDGYHYIGIPKWRFDEWFELNDRSERAGWKWVRFKNVTAWIPQKCAQISAAEVYVFKVKFPSNYRDKFKIKKEYVKFRDVQYIGKSVNFVLQPADIFWKDLIYNKRNEKGNK